MALDGTITDVPEVDIDAAAEALLKRWSGKQSSAPERAAVTPPAEEVEEDEDEERPEHEEEVEDSEEEAEQEGEEKPQRQLASDDHDVVVSVDGQNHRVAVKDLKRLFGQEASLTRKSQEIATLRSQTAEVAEKHATALNSMLERATERLKPYANVDWALAAARLSDEDYQQLKGAADTLRSDVEYYRTELNDTIGKARTEQTTQMKQAAEQCVATITNPESPSFIEGWNDEVYTNIRQHAISLGATPQVVDNVVDPVAIKIMHKAMLYDKAQKTAVKKLANAPKNVNKTPTNDGHAANGGSRQAMEKLRQSGEPDDAAAALLARWSS